MKKTRLILFLLLVSTLAACSSLKHNAPVSERKVGDTVVSKPADDRSYYVVKKGDTLYRIALDFGQSYQELVVWNQLANPNDLKIDQVLRVAPPTLVGKSGAQTAAIATNSSGIETRQLAPPTAPNKTEPNGDKQPYSESKLAEMKKPDNAVSEQQDGGDDSVSWMWPASGKVVSAFDDSKKGIDIAGKSGQAVLAASTGKVMYAGSGIRGYGNLVIVKHNSTLLSAYAHNKKILVKEGQAVTKGQKIAEMGDSDADAIKLHFEIRQQGKPVDPLKYLPNR
tara:strand:+ start:30371 stop:31213 length:843 start_codon:yes stop_codon:yes gene_type:complete